MYTRFNLFGAIAANWGIATVAKMLCFSTWMIFALHLLYNLED